MSDFRYSLYDQTILASNPGYFYPLDDPATGTDYKDYSAQNLHLTTRGGSYPTNYITGEPSLLSGYPLDSSTRNKQNIALGRRANNGIFDHPGLSATYPTLALMAWIRPDTTLGDQPVIVKTSMYQLVINSGGAIRGQISGLPDFITDGKLIRPNGVYCIGQHFDGPAGKWRIFCNGQTFTREIPTTSTVPYNASFQLYVGGQQDFGSGGFQGRIAKVAKWDVIPTYAQFQAFYLAGEAQPMEIIGPARDVFPFSIIIWGSVPSDYGHRFILNESDVSIWVVESGSAAIPGAGMRLLPGQRGMIGDNYKGPVSAVHRGVGPKRISVKEEPVV